MPVTYESYQPASNRQSSMKTVKRAVKRKGGKRLAILVLLLCAFWAIWQAEHQTRVAPVRESLLEDLGSLWDLTNNEMTGGAGAAGWTIRWNMTARNGTMEALASGLFTDAAGSPAGTTVEQNGKTVKGELPNYGGRVTLSIVAATGESEQLMLLYEAGETIATNETGELQLTKQELLQAADAVSSEIEAFTNDYESSMNAKGFTENNDAIGAISRLALAKQVDSYEDGGTISDTFFTNEIKSEVIVENGQRGNLQIALHRSTEDQKLELVVGVPVITGDYSRGNE